MYATSIFATFVIWDEFPFPYYICIEVASFLLYASLDSTEKNGNGESHMKK